MNRRSFLAGAVAAPLLAGVQRAGAAGTRRPNVLILMTDQERHQDRLPDGLPTPARCWLDEHGTRIDRFHVSSMACSPSRACFWTGMYAPQQGIYGTFVLGTQFTMDPAIPTIGDLFKELGYRTAFFGKWHLSFPGEPPTNAEAAFDLAQGGPLKGYGFDDSAISPPADVGGYNDGVTNDPVWTAQAVAWLKAHARDEQPWLCVLSLLNPHDIQFYPRGFRADFQRPDYGARPEPSFFAEPTTGDKPSVHARFRNVASVVAGTPPGTTDQAEYFVGQLNTYYDLIVGTDAMLGAAVKAVMDAGALEDTIVVRTSDHGELGSAHRMQNKGTTQYDEQNRIPFTVVWKGHVPAGRRSQALGEAVDLVPTLLELCGERDPVGRFPWLRGVSLATALTDPDARGPRDSVLFRTDEFPITNVGTSKPLPNHVRAIYDGRLKLARYVAVAENHFAGPEVAASQELELYDTWEDPHEIRNLANDPGYAGLVADLLAWLHEREAALWGPVTVPAFGPSAPVDRLPDIDSVEVTDANTPNPWLVSPRPGSYLVVPAPQPTPARFLYEGGLPTGLGGPSAAQRAVDHARFFCELGASR